MHYKYKNCVEVGYKVANFLFYALLWLFCLVLLKKIRKNFIFYINATSKLVKLKFKIQNLKIKINKKILRFLFLNKIQTFIIIQVF